MLKFTFFYITILFYSFFSYSQTDSSIEFGLSTGVSVLKTDYFEEEGFINDLTENSGLMLGVIAYFNVFNNSKSELSHNWANQHLKLRGELSYQRANLNHYNIASNSPLKNMHGVASILNLGTVMEYYPLSLPDFITINKKTRPFISLGIFADYSKPSVELDTGDWENNPSLLIESYRGEALNVDSKLALSLLFSGGIRYNFNENSALLFDIRWQSFSTDYIDAIKPEVSGNKHNDWLYSINIGYMFTLGKHTKSSTWSK